MLIAIPFEVEDKILRGKQFIGGYLSRDLKPSGMAMSVRTLVMASLRDFFCSLVMR